MESFVNDVVSKWYRHDTTLAEPKDPGPVNSGHPFDDFNLLYEEGLKAAGMRDNKRRRPRFYNLIQMFNLTAGVAGRTAEIGCFRGLSSYLLCQTTKNSRPDYTGNGHQIFDSFEGLSVPVKADGIPANDAAGRFSTTSVDHVRNTLKPFPDVEIHKGWVPDVFEGLPVTSYRFVHIDVDLYAPTLDCLNFFYPKLSTGGVIVVDDFGPWPGGGRYPGCSRAVAEFCSANNLTYAAFAAGNAVIRKI
ncbi:MAG: TylF/MycF/NovP-related O-methyltransferase [Planctomycetota bacterium]